MNVKAVTFTVFYLLLVRALHQGRVFLLQWLLEVTTYCLKVISVMNQGVIIATICEDLRAYCCDFHRDSRRKT